MRTTDLLKASFLGLFINPMRTALTGLGIAIGVGAIVLVSSIGQSIEGLILEQISSLGPKSMVVFPGRSEGSHDHPGMKTGSESITFEDIDALKKLSTITSIAPVVFVPGKVVVGNEESLPRVFGIAPEFFSNQRITVSLGRLLDSLDEEGGVHSAVLGSEVAEELFGSRDPLGQRIRIGENSFTIVGVAAAIGSQFFQNTDDRIYVPLKVARDLTKQQYANYATFQAIDDLDLASEDVRLLLRKRHSIRSDDGSTKEDDFTVRTSVQANEILSGVGLAISAFITTVAGIALIVGGIGIMNIMLVVVAERTREIGLRIAIGARARDVFRQFLLESIFLTAFGGLLGILGGIFGAKILAALVQFILPNYAFELSPIFLVLAFLMAIICGVTFGALPAKKAANLQPVDALRYE